MSDNGEGDLYRVVKHPAAEDDVRDMVAYVALQSSLEAALEWASRLDDFIDSLNYMPTKFPVFADPPPRAIHRTHFEQNRQIYYDVFAPERVVRILYVWHGRRGETPDLERRDDPLTP